MASTWASLNVRAVEVPRCPEVPKATRCARLRRIRPLVEVGADEGVDVDEVGRVRQLPGVLAHAHAAVTYPVGAVATLAPRMLAASSRPAATRAPSRPRTSSSSAARRSTTSSTTATRTSRATRAAPPSTPRARSGASASRSPIWAASRPIASARRLERMLAADGVRLDAVVRTDEPTTLALAELDETGSARYRFYERATSAPGPDARGRARRAAARRRDPARRHAGPDARADGHRARGRGRGAQRAARS